MKQYKIALNMALSMFTVIPLPKYVWEESAARHMMKFYPFIGFIIGTVWYGAFQLLDSLNVSSLLSAGILLAIPFVLTGFLHLDGFMDVCDALLSRRSKEEKLKILKDSHVGAFAVISLVLLFIIQFATLQTIISSHKNPLFLIVIPIISRSLVAYFLITKDPISESYLGRLFKTGTTKVDVIVLLCIYTLTFSTGIWIPLLMGISTLLLIAKTHRELGGMNGDVAGYVLVLTEFIGLLTLATI